MVRRVTWRTVYTPEGEIPRGAHWQTVYTPTGEIPRGIHWQTIYTPTGEIPGKVVHPPFGRYSFLYDEGASGLSVGVTPTDGNPIEGLLLAAREAVAGQVIPPDTLRQIIQSDGVCDIVEHIQRNPSHADLPFPDDHLTIGYSRFNFNVGTNSFRREYRLGWTRGRTGNVWWTAIGFEFDNFTNITAGSTTESREFGMRFWYEIADAEPDWYSITPTLPTGENSPGTIFQDRQRLQWAWDYQQGSGPQPWYDCNGVYNRVPEWQTVYTPQGNIPAWQTVYTPAGEIQIWQTVYQPRGEIAQGWRTVYTPEGEILGWQTVYTPEGEIPRGITGWQTIYTPTGEIVLGERFQTVYTPTGELQRGAHWQTVYTPRGPIVGETVDVERPGRDPLSIGDNLLRGSVRIGRSEASHLAKVLPMQMQLIIDNSSGNFGPEELGPQHKIRWAWRGIIVGVGWVSRSKTDTDHETGLSTVIVTVEGAFNRLTRSFHELSLFITETARTGEVMNDALDQAGWPAGDRNIARGQVRLHPAHYASVLAGRRIHSAIPVMRAMEDAEIGLLHEGRGDTPSFQDRFFRELDPRDPVFSFGTLEGHIPTEKTVSADEAWDNVYTVIQVGAERAVVQSDRKLWELQTDVPLRVGEGFVVDLLDEDDPGIQNRAVRSVIAWSPLGDDDAEGIRVELIGRTRTRTWVRALETGTLTKLELRGRGVALYGNLAIPERADAAASRLYGRRVLNLPKSFIGDGTNTGGDAIAEGQAHADLLL